MTIMTSSTENGAQRRVKLQNYIDDGNHLHSEMLTLASETSILLCVKCQNKLPLFDDTVLQYAV